jgi:hypothetical protein
LIADNGTWFAEGGELEALQLKLLAKFIRINEAQI